MLNTALELSGPWLVRFDTKWGGPDRVTFPTLEDWTRRSEPGIQHYSGIATYEKQFEWKGSTHASNSHCYLELGEVRNMARVRLNGHDLGVAWCPPWRVDVTGMLKPGNNHVQIEVANLWINRLIADAALPENQRLTWTTSNPYRADSPLSPSGLLGPVVIRSAQ